MAKDFQHKDKRNRNKSSSASKDGYNRYSTKALTSFKIDLLIDTLNENGGNISAAAKTIDIDRTAIYKLRNIDENFRKQLSLAIEHGKENLADEYEAELKKRILEGKDKFIYENGELTKQIVEKSDVALMFALKGLKPDVYGDKITTKTVNTTDSPPTQVSEEVKDFLNKTQEAIGELIKPK